jgi:epoxyqueuosine reductase
MFLDADKKLAAEILKMARKFGADLAGFIDVESLQRSPSHKMHAKLPQYTLASDNAAADPGNPAAVEENQSPEVKVNFPKEAQTILIIAICHPEQEPALDYWRNPFPGGTEGNLRLIRINDQIIQWLKNNENITGLQIPYAIEKGGIYLKDAAVLAGLGIIGKNNLLITPQFGPRVRLRAMALPVNLPATGPLDFDPCAFCDAPCRRICPQGAFDEKVYSSMDFGQTELPAREGVYARKTCKLEMDKNRDEAELIPIEGGETMRVTAHCRACEFGCPVGSAYSTFNF